MSLAASPTGLSTAPPTLPITPATGNIVRKSDFGLYAYSGSKPHAVSGISSLIAGTGEERTCEAEYNIIGKVSKLVLKNGGNSFFGAYTVC